MKKIQDENITWVDIKNPNDKNLKWLKENFNLHPLVIEELRPKLDHPKMEKFDDYIFLVLFYPFFDRENFRTIPFEIDIIVSRNYIITTHHKDIVPLKKIFDKCNIYEDIRKDYFKKGTEGLLYEIIQELLQASFPKLGHIKENIEDIEKSIYKEQPSQETVSKISLIQRDIIGFQRILEPEKVVLEKLQKQGKKIFKKSFIPYLRDLTDLHKQITKILETNKEILDTLHVTNQAILDTRTNRIITTLTIFSVIVLPLTFISGIFGMNIPEMPLTNSPKDFWILIGGMFIIAVGLTFFFKKKNWF